MTAPPYFFCAEVEPRGCTDEGNGGPNTIVNNSSRSFVSMIPVASPTNELLHISKADEGRLAPLTPAIETVAFVQTVPEELEQRAAAANDTRRRGSMSERVFERSIPAATPVLARIAGLVSRFAKRRSRAQGGASAAR